MFVIIAYDVKDRRDAKVLKICRKYLQHEQKSVFEGYITDGQLKKLKSEIARVIIPEDDSFLIYEFGNTKYSGKEILGKYSENSNIL